MYLNPNDDFPKHIAAYLQKYSLSGWHAEINSERYFNNVVVIPAIKEYDNILRLLDSLSDNNQQYFHNTLFLFIINNAKNGKEEVRSENQQTIAFLQRIIAKKEDDDGLIKKILDSKMNVGLINASGKGNELPDKDAGVGLARKIGMDIALKYFDYSNESENILICLDADCTVESNYLSSVVNTFNRQNIHAAYVSYEHKLPASEKEKYAIVCYEIFLRYFLLGLKYANSPFAFPSIGSTMVCDTQSYCKVGGMNKRKAAEDFYFMEKLAKVAKIHKIEGTKVYPSSRGSWRVPFGTGQRVNRFLSNTHEEYLLYNPESFVILKTWLDVFDSPLDTKADLLLDKAEEIHPQLKVFLETNSFAESWNKIIKNAKSEEQIQKQKLMWFDGFRTLKLIHFLRDTVYPQINMFDAVDKILELITNDIKIKRDELIPSIEIQIKYLNALRSIT